jgi:Amt family ammonium transporter
MGGVLGVIALGIFANTGINAGGGQGLLTGETHFFFVQVLAALGSAAYAFIFTYVMLALINLVTKVRVSEEVEDAGLDQGIHGEMAYDEGVV